MSDHTDTDKPQSSRRERLSPSESGNDADTSELGDATAAGIAKRKKEERH